MGIVLLICALGLVLVRNLHVQTTFLVISWFIFWLRLPRIGTITLFAVSLLALSLSPSVLQSRGVSLYFYYDLIQASPIYAVPRLWIDPWSLPWIYDDSPFHFMAEPSRPLTAAILSVLFGVLIIMTSVMKSKHADD